MKKGIFTLALAITLLAGTIFTGCESSPEKVVDAQANVNEAKQDLKEAQEKEAAEKQKAADAEDWKTFKIEAEAKIKSNEVRIDDLRAKMKKSGKTMDALYEKKIDSIEERNKELKARMETYEKNPSNWASFKQEFNHDMDGIGQAFKDLGTNNKN